jgi:hypothetical protein
MALSMVRFRNEIKTILTTMSKEWMEMWNSDMPAVAKDSFLRHYKYCRTYILAFFVSLFAIVTIYAIACLPIYGFHKLPWPLRLPGTPANTWPSYLYQFLVLIFVVQYSTPLNLFFVICTIHISMRIDYLVDSTKVDNLDLKKFHEEHKALLDLVEMVVQLLAAFGIVLTSNMSLYLCADVFIIIKV